jgi:hypothetical protein
MFYVFLRSNSELNTHSFKSTSIQYIYVDGFAQSQKNPLPGKHVQTRTGPTIEEKYFLCVRAIPDATGE